jgi:3-hydroxyisobutyrate dehydrogenase-like beta-hydroxyacid dehydrogenase
LTVTQNYVHHFKVELHERDAQLAVSQAQAAELQDAVEHL